MRVTNTISLFFGLSLIGLYFWTNRFFGAVTIDQALSTISFSAHGLLSADSVFIMRFMEWCLFWPGVLVLVIQGLLLVSQKRGLNKRFSTRLSRTTLLVGFILLIQQYHLVDFLISLHNDHRDLFKLTYVNPAKITIKAKHPKNLVLIYVESLETTYSNKSLFERDLLASLNAMTSKDTHFKDYEQLPGASWTMAGIIASQCGIPLRTITIFSGNRVGENISHYLPGATCLSDILDQHGYKNVFIKGAELSFSGINVFLQDHHYQEAYGKHEWQLQGVKESDMSGWGLYDDQLFAKAKVKLAKLLKGKQPFNLTILTVDTHGYKGMLSKSCQAKGVGNFSDIVECTGDEVSNFVGYIKKKGWLDRVDVVVLGDHLAMENDVSDKLKRAKERTIYNAFISRQPIEKNTDQIVHYDVLPTILDMLGFSYPTGKLALGYSAIRQPRAEAPVDRMQMLVNIDKHYSLSYNQLWSTAHNTTQ